MILRVVLLLVVAAATVSASTAPGVKLPELQRFIGPNYVAVAGSADERHTAVVIVNADGTVREVTIRDAKETPLSKAVLTTIRKWVFLPALKGGQPIPAQVLIPFSYESATGELTIDLGHYTGE